MLELISTQSGREHPPIYRIPDRPKEERTMVMGFDLFRLKQTAFGRFYDSHLKRIPGVSRVSGWILWRILPPIQKTILLLNRKRRMKLIRLSEYMKKHLIGGVLISEACTNYLIRPEVWPVTQKNIFFLLPESYNFPEIWTTVVKNGIQCGGTNLVIAKDEVVHHDLYDFNRDYTSEELHARTIIDPMKDCILFLDIEKKREVIPEAACFVDACASNYAHWMTEVLPKIGLFCAIDDLKNIPIVVNEGLHENIMQSLYFVVQPTRKILILPIGRAISVNDLYVTSAVGYVPFDLRRRSSDNGFHGRFSVKAIECVRKRIFKNVYGGKAKSWPKKIYLRRHSGTRKIVNAFEIENLLSNKGFETIEPENLSFAQQVQIFKNAKVIIGATGAAFANGIFCQKGAEVIIFMGRHKRMIYGYWNNLLSPLGVYVKYVLGEITQNEHLGIHGDFVIPVNDVIDLISAYDEL